MRKFGFNIKGIEELDFMKPNSPDSPDSIAQLGYPPVRIDILTSISGVNFQEAWKRRKNGHYGRAKVWYISRRDFIENKFASGRKKDQLDLDILVSASKKRAQKKRKK